MAEMDEELKKLYSERDELNQKIAEIKGRCTQFGNAKLQYDIFGGSREDKYCLSYKVTTSSDEKHAWRGIGRSADRAQLIETIPTIIRDLQGLYDKLKSEGARI